MTPASLLRAALAAVPGILPGALLGINLERWGKTVQRTSSPALQGRQVIARGNALGWLLLHAEPCKGETYHLGLLV